MPSLPVIAIFDIGKTNKKLFLFDERYNIVWEESGRFTETLDEDGDACESIGQLQRFVFDSLQTIFQRSSFAIKAVNVATYGASFVHLDEEGQPVAPLYNYLKTYPADLLKQFYRNYGGEAQFSVTTASPVLGHLNSGLQLYWLKHRRPQLFEKIQHSLHLPQFVSYLLTGNRYSDLTSIGCHTGLWDFSMARYHAWVQQEGLLEKLAPVIASTHVVPAAVRNGNYLVGVGLHDSSAALIPYLASFHEPFILLSTGTWTISLNPFNQSPLTAEELEQDCLCYLTYKGKPVKASRLFAGNEHEQQVKRLADHYGKQAQYYTTVRFDPYFLQQVEREVQEKSHNSRTVKPINESLFGKRDLSVYATYEEAYHQLMQDIVTQQCASTNLVLKGTTIKRMFVDGGFSKNPVYMHLLAAAFPAMEVYAASMAQATALGAAMAIHAAWNSQDLPSDMIALNYYGMAQDA